MSTSPSVTGEKEYRISKKTVDKINELAERFPDKNSALIPALHLIQDEIGWVPYSAVRQLSDILNIAPNKIYGVLRFYTMFHTEPVGTYHVQVCRNVSCSLLGANHIITHLTDKLGIEPGETSDDKKFTLSTVECLGACGTAPVMMINDTYYENLTESKVDEILDSLQ